MTRTKDGILQMLTPEQMAGEIVRLDAQIARTQRAGFAAAALPVAAAMHPDGHPKGWAGVAEISFRIADEMMKASEA